MISLNGYKHIDYNQANCMPTLLTNYVLDIDLEMVSRETDAKLPVKTCFCMT